VVIENLEWLPNRGWVYGFCYTHSVLGIWKKFQNRRTAESGYLKTIRCKEEQLVLGIFNKFKEPLGFIKEPTETRQF
jgi:hypothetical protein